jgi:hypothetical protein
MNLIFKPCGNDYQRFVNKYAQTMKNYYMFPQTNIYLTNIEKGR